MTNLPDSIELLSPASGVVFTTRFGGVSKAPFDTLNLKKGLGDKDSDVIANRQAVAEAAGAVQDWIEGEQVHGSEVLVHIVGRSAAGPADALVTRVPDVPLAMFTADCAPVALVGKHGVAAVHVGWRGLVSGVIDQALDALDEQEAMAWVGPTIGPCHYEVGPEVPAAFARRYPLAHSFISDRGGRKFFDLPSAVRWVLYSRGARVQADVAPCTFCDDRFFSYRRDGLTGRQAVLVWKIP